MSLFQHQPLQERKSQFLSAHLPAACDIVEKELGESIDLSRVVPVTTGLTNFVYRARARSGQEFIVRLNTSDNQDYRYRMYQRSSFVTSKLLANELKVNRVLSTGTIPFAYSFEECSPGQSADRLASSDARRAVFFEVGQVMRRVNCLKDSGFGQDFDYAYDSSPTLGSVRKFLQFVRTQLSSPILQESELLSVEQAEELLYDFQALYNGQYSVGYVHGDLRLENVLANDEGLLSAIVDWDLVRLDLTPLADFAQALSTASIPEQELSYPQNGAERQALLDGYQIDYDVLRKDVDTFRLGRALLTSVSFLQYRPEHPSTVKAEDAGWDYRISRHILKTRNLIHEWIQSR